MLEDDYLKPSTAGSPKSRNPLRPTWNGEIRIGRCTALEFALASMPFEGSELVLCVCPSQRLSKSPGTRARRRRDGAALVALRFCDTNLRCPNPVSLHLSALLG